MSFDLPEIGVGFNVDMTALDTGLTKAKRRIQQFGNQAERSANGMVNGFKRANSAAEDLSDSIDLMKGAAVVGLAGAVAVASTEVAKFSEQAEKVDRYFSNTFGSMADEARAWALGLSDDYGIYSGEIERYMASLMEAFERAGNGVEDSYRMAKDFTQLSWDLSVKLPQYELQDIQDWLKDLAVGGGEEALEKLTAGFDDEDLKRYARQLGIVGEELTVVQKQQAAYALIMDQHGQSLGGYVDGIGGATGALTRMTATFSELKETVGWFISPVVEGAANAITKFLDEVNEKLSNAKRGIENIKSFLEGIFGGGSKDEANETVEATDKITQALGTLTQAAIEANNAMNGLAGFDRLFVMDSQHSPPDKGDADWEGAFQEWASIFDPNDISTVRAMDKLWAHLLDEGYTTIDEIKKHYGQYFDWMLTSSLANENISAEERRAIMDRFYHDLSIKLTQYHENKLTLEKAYEDKIHDYEIGATSETLEEIEETHRQSMAQLKESTMASVAATVVEVQEDFGILTETMADKMQEAFKDLITEISNTYSEAMDIVENMVQDMILDIDRLIARLNQIPNMPIGGGGSGGGSHNTSKPTGGSIVDAAVEGYIEGMKDPAVPGMSAISGAITGAIDEASGGWFTSSEKWIEDNIGAPIVDAFASAGNWLKDKLGFAEGGVFEPNDPQFVKVGDSTTHREVIAPEDMIEAAAYRAAVRAVNDSNGSRAEVVVPITLEVDGKTLARATYRYFQGESRRQGNSW